MKFDLHVHSRHSFDSLSRIERIVSNAARAGLDGICVCDHSTLAGYVEAAGLVKRTGTGFIVVPGAEVRTDKDDVIALFIQELPRNREFFGFCDEVREQAGLVVLAHPYKASRPDKDVARRVDAVETVNGRMPWQANELSGMLAKEYGKPAVGGSDAHFASEVGNAFTTAQEVDTAEGLRKAIMRGRTKAWGAQGKRRYRLASWAVGKVKGALRKARGRATT